jgi:hypothetical protein
MEDVPRKRKIEQDLQKKPKSRGGTKYKRKTKKGEVFKDISSESIFD